MGRVSLANCVMCAQGARGRRRRSAKGSRMGKRSILVGAAQHPGGPLAARGCCEWATTLVGQDRILDAVRRCPCRHARLVAQWISAFKWWSLQAPSETLSYGPPDANQEDYHEETEQSGNAVRYRRPGDCCKCADHRQLAQRYVRTGLEKRHQRAVLAQCQL